MNSTRRLLPLVLLLAVSCVKHEASEVCDNDSECDDDLSCLAVIADTSGGCEELSNVCSQTCSSDADCRELGDGSVEFRCFSQCDGSSICGRAEAKTDDLPASAVCEETLDCAEGLECLAVSQFDADDQCTVVGQACSITCETDADCAELGAEFECFAGCSGDSVCGARG